MYRLTLALLLALSVTASATYYDSSRHAASRLHFDKKTDYPAQDEPVYKMHKKHHHGPVEYLPVTRRTTSRYVLNEKAARSYWRTYAHPTTTTPYPVRDVANGRVYEAADKPAEAPAAYPTTPAYVPTTPAQDPTTPPYNPTTPSYDPVAPTYVATTPAQDPTTQRYVPTIPPQDPTTTSYVPPAPVQDLAVLSYVPAAPAQDPRTPSYIPTTPAQDPTTTPYVPPTTPAQDSTVPPYAPTQAPYVPTTPAQDPTTPPYVDTTRPYVAPVEDVPVYLTSSDGAKAPIYVETTTVYVPPAREEPVNRYVAPVQDAPVSVKFEAPAKNMHSYAQPAKDTVRFHPVYKNTYTTSKYVLDEGAARKYWATATYPTTTKAVKYDAPSYVAPLAARKVPARDRTVKPSYGY